MKKNRQIRTNLAKPEKAQVQLNHYAPYLAVFLITTLVFGRVLGQDFVKWDDDIQVYANPYLYPITTYHFARFWLHPLQALYIPLTYSTWSVLAAFAVLPQRNYALPFIGWKYDPHVFHSANLIVHCINACVTYSICFKLSNKRAASLLGALLFALHPLQVESVAWVSELRGLLAAAFALGAVRVHLWALDAANGSPILYWKREAAGVALGALSLLCKPSSVILPLVLLALDIGFTHRSWKRALPSLLAYLVIPLGFVIITHYVQPVPVALQSALWARPIIVGDSLTFYLRKLLWPGDYGIDYGRTPAFVAARPLLILEWLFPVGAGVIAYLVRSRAPQIGAALLILVLAVLPVSGIVPFVFQEYSTVADRYVYFGMLGPSLALAFLLPNQVKDRSFVCVSFVILAFAAVTFLRIPDWDNTYSLMTASVKANPQSAVAHLNLGMAYEDQHDDTNALSQYILSAKYGHTDAKPYIDMALILWKQGDLGGAIADLKNAASVDPQNIRSYIYLGDLLLFQHRTADAEVAYKAAIQIDPRDPIPYYDMADIEMQKKNFAIAEEGFRASESLDSHDPYTHFHLGAVLLAEGKKDEARSELTQAVALGCPDIRAQSLLNTLNNQ